MSEEKRAAVGDILEYRCPNFGIVWQWRVLSVCLGAERQESLIELQPIMAKAGRSVNGVEVTSWVPEPLTRHLDIYRSAKDQPHD